MVENVYAFANQKGGVGKTTSCVNLAASLAACGQKVLLLDLDPQGNATMGSGVDKSSVLTSMTELLTGEVSANNAIIRNTPAGYDLIAGNSDLTAAEVILLKRTHQEHTLRDALRSLDQKYDYIFIDCPPSLNMLTLNAMVAADSVIIAMQCEYYALEGLSDLLATVKKLQSTLNPELGVSGIIRTMFDNRNKLCVDVSQQLIEHFGNIVFQTVIPRNIRLAEAPSHGLPVLLYDKTSRGAAAYMALGSEMLRRRQQRTERQQKKQVFEVV